MTIRWYRIAAILAVGLLASATRAQAPAGRPFGSLGGVRVSCAQATVASRLARHVLRTLAEDRTLARQPTHVALVHTLMERLKRKWPLEPAAPKVLIEKRPMQAFVTLYSPSGGELSAGGNGESLAEAIVDATVLLARNPKYAIAGFSRLAQVRIALDVTVFEVPFMVNLAEPFLYSFRPGIDGLVYENGDQQGIVLPWEAGRRAWDLRYKKPGEEEVYEARPARSPEDVKAAVFRTLVERAGSQMGAWRTPAARVLRFEVQSFVEPVAGGKGPVIALYRTGPLVRHESLTDGDAAVAAMAAADYLARTTNKDKEIRGGFDPLRNRWVDDFNGPRQAIVAAALARYHRTGRQAWMLRAAKTLAVPLVQALRRGKFKDPSGRERSCAWIGEPLKAELADSAQVLVGLAEVQRAAPDDRVLQAITQLADTLLLSQNGDGSFNQYFVPGTSKDLVARDTENLRGESLCLLAMARAFEQTGREDVLRAARKTAEYLAFRREKKLGQAESVGVDDPILVEAMAALDVQLGNDALVRYAARCAGALVDKQLTDASQSYLDELGGFLEGVTYPDAEYTSFCLRSLRSLEQMAARIEAESPSRYALLGLAVPRERARAAARRARAFLMGLQYTPQNLFYTGTAKVAVGGFRHSAYDSRISTIAVANFLLAAAK
jgi:hypothetical protein